MSLRDALSQLGFDPEREFIAAYRQIEPEDQAALILRLLAILETSGNSTPNQAHDDGLSQFLTNLESKNEHQRNT